MVLTAQTSTISILLQVGGILIPGVLREYLPDILDPPTTVQEQQRNLIITVVSTRHFHRSSANNPITTTTTINLDRYNQQCITPLARTVSQRPALYAQPHHDHAGPRQLLQSIFTTGSTNHTTIH